MQGRSTTWGGGGGGGGGILVGSDKVVCEIVTHPSREHFIIKLNTSIPHVP